VIRLRGVRHHNLKNFDLDLPLHQLIVITGLSGSGKSSLAFDTLFAEGQRRYIETFSPYARQFFDRMDKPQVDSIEGIPPAIAIEQRNAVRTTRSTVGTMTEICDHMKVLWPHIAQLHCRQCGQPVRKDSPQKIWESLGRVGRASSRAGQATQSDGSSGASPHREVLITFDVPLSGKLSLAESLGLVSKQGYQRLLFDRQIVSLDEAPSRIAPQGSRVTSLTVIQDRLKLTPNNRARFVEACEQAYHFGKGKLAAHGIGGSQGSPKTKDEEEKGAGPHFALLTSRLFSNRFHCAECDIEYREPVPALFSFNHPAGACPTCRGFGRVISIDYDLAIPDRSLTLAEGAVKPWRSGFSAECQADLTKFCKVRRVPMDVPFANLSEEHRRWIIEGDPDYGSDEEHEWPRAWYGVKGYFRWLESKAYKMHVRVLLSRYRAYTACPDCRGARFQPEALLYRFTLDDSRLTSRRADTRARIREGAPIANRQPQITLADFYALPVSDALLMIEALAASRITHHPSRTLNDPVALVLSEVHSRLRYLHEVGLGYLTLDRPTRSLSGGETERVNLTTCLGTRLVNTLFVLDEPSVGLHPRDTERLVRILQQLRNAGNTVVVVEHEPSVMRAADRIIDLGPGHGATGGQIVFQGTYPEILTSGVSLTGQYLSGRRQIEVPERRPVRVAHASSMRVRRPSLPRVHPGSKVVAGTRGQDACATLKISHATHHNLKDLTVEIPLGRFVCVTGVSGSGKTTLIREVLLPALRSNLNSQTSDSKSSTAKASDRFEERREDETSTLNPQPSTLLAGWQNLERVVLVDQSILGKTPRSNPAVYIGAFDLIREFFAQSGPAKQRALNASAFSFNSSQGQCERCRGAGFEKIEMQFLSDVFIRCPDCGGRRYRHHILEVKIEVSGVRSQAPGKRGRPGLTPGTSHSTPVAWSIADLLDATVDETVEFLGAFPSSCPAQRAVEGLNLLQEVGLGYLRLGQPINTLSGGECQRLKLVRHLAEAAVAANVNSRFETSVNGSGRQPRSSERRRELQKPTLFLFDEPTTGLHFDDVRVLLGVFQRLVDAGHSVVVIEHNLDVIKSADWVIDLGPDGGAEGGRIVAEGAPEEIAEARASHTGRFLRDLAGARSRASHCAQLGSQFPGTAEHRAPPAADKVAVSG